MWHYTISAAIRSEGTNVVGIKKRQTLSLFLPLQYRMSHIMNWTIQQAKEITQRARKEKILGDAVKTCFFFGTRSRFSFLAIGLKARSELGVKRISAKGHFEVFILKHKQIAQWDCSFVALVQCRPGCKILWWVELVEHKLMPKMFRTYF